MTQVLQQALESLHTLPEAQQNEIAMRLLEEIEGKYVNDVVDDNHVNANDKRQMVSGVKCRVTQLVVSGPAFV